MASRPALDGTPAPKCGGLLVLDATAQELTGMSGTADYEVFDCASLHDHRAGNPVNIAADRDFIAGRITALLRN